ERVETWIDNAMLGDMLFDATYSGYKDFNGVKFPTKIVQKQGDYPILDLTITDVKPNIAANIHQPAPQAPPAAAQAPSEKPGGAVHLGKTGGGGLLDPWWICGAGRGLQGLYRRDRRPTERGTRQRDHLKDQRVDTEQADPVCR